MDGLRECVRACMCTNLTARLRLLTRLLLSRQHAHALPLLTRQHPRSRITLKTSNLSFVARNTQGEEIILTL